MVSCEDIIQEISNYLDGNLDEDLKRTLEIHLKCCHHCQVVLDTTRKTVELYCDGKLFQLPEEVRGRLHSALRQKCQAQTK